MTGWEFSLLLVAWAVGGASPGPATLAIAGTSMERGRAAGVAVAAGIVCGSASWGIAAALGMSALMLANAWMVELLRYVGAAYLMYLGFKALKSSMTDKPLAQVKAKRGDLKALYILWPDVRLCGLQNSDGAAVVILGIGTDLANIERIEKTLERFGDRFRNRVFTEVEQRKAERRKDVAGTYAKRWAAKEACSKALGTGLRMGIAWKDMAVSNLATGQPVMEVTGWAQERLREMTPEGHEAVIHVTLTDDHPWAQAFVVIEARPCKA